MLRKAEDIMGFTLGTLDGEIGQVKDFYFDDENWTVRYLVADTGKWLLLRQVLISPFAVRGFREHGKKRTKVSHSIMPLIARAQRP